MSGRLVLGIPCPSWCTLETHVIGQETHTYNEGAKLAPQTPCEPGSLMWFHHDESTLVRYDVVSEDGQQQTVGITYVEVDGAFLNPTEARKLVRLIQQLGDNLEGPDAAA